MAPVKFKIITREGCPFCKKLKEWLSDKDVEWTEIDIDDPILSETVMKDEKFVSIYCDMSMCIEDTPVIIKNENQYFYGEIWDFTNNTLNEGKAKEIFEI